MIDPRKVIEQILIQYASTIEVVAKSDGITFQHEESCKQIVAKFGKPDSENFNTVFVSRVGEEVLVFCGQSFPGGLRLRALILTRIAYESWPDPFRLSEHFPPDWSAKGEVHGFVWSPEVVQLRQVLALQNTLKTSDSVLLLGATQALINGNKLLLTGEDARPELVRQIWAMLPDVSRCELFPASLATSADSHFDVMVLATPPNPWPEDYLTGQQVRDYPEGGYELALQIAIESGNQAELDRLVTRRSSRQAFKLALMLLGVLIGVTLIVRWVV